MGWLSTSGVEILPHPQSSPSQLCASEWQAHGSCCSTQSLRKFGLKEKVSFLKTMATATFQLSDTVKILHSSLQDFEALKKVMATEGTKQELVDDLTEFVRFVHSDLLQVTQNAEQDKVCIDVTQKMRSATLCYACSGRSQLFFSDQRARISLQDCVTTIKDCSSTWLKLLSLVEGLGTAERIVTALGKYYPTEFAQIKMELALPIKKWVLALKTRPEIRRCLKNPETDCPQIAKGVCENLIVLHSKTFLEVAMQILGAELPQFELLQHGVSLVVEKLQIGQAKTSAVQSKSLESKNLRWRLNSGGRQLNTAERVVNSFRADTQVIVGTTKNCTTCIPLKADSNSP